MNLPVQQLALQPVTSEQFPLNNDKVKTQAFSEELRDQNTNSEVIALSDKQAAVIHVVDYKPAAVRPLDEVKADLDKAIQHDKALAAVEAEAKTLLAKLQQGESIDAAVTAKQGKVAVHAGVHREDQTLDQQLVSALFKQAKPQEGKPVYSQVGLFDGDQVLMA